VSSAAPMGPGGLMWSPIEPTAAGVPVCGVVSRSVKEL
jgi:hypothetical protein